MRVDVECVALDRRYHAYLLALGVDHVLADVPVRGRDADLGLLDAARALGLHPGDGLLVGGLDDLLVGDLLVGDSLPGGRLRDRADGIEGLALLDDGALENRALEELGALDGALVEATPQPELPGDLLLDRPALGQHGLDHRALLGPPAFYLAALDDVFNGILALQEVAREDGALDALDVDGLL